MCININYVYTDSMHLVSASDISLEKTQNTYENLRKKYFIFFLVGDLQVVTQSLTPGVSLNDTYFVYGMTFFSVFGTFFTFLVSC